MISFIIPAHDEELLIGKTLSAIHIAARTIDEPYEIVVANDSPTDRTADIALEYGALVIAVDRRQIAATRNAGARAAVGDILVFVDADTEVNVRVLRAAVRVVRGGAVGGGCSVRLDGQLPLYAVVLERILQVVCPVVGLAAGCFLFCTRRAYLATGGFDESLYATEEVDFGRRLKRRGRFVVLHEFVTTSARKLRVRTAIDLLKLAARLVLEGSKSLRQRDGLEYWYALRSAPCTGRAGGG